LWSSPCLEVAAARFQATGLPRALQAVEEVPLSGGSQVISQRCGSWGDGWSFGNTFGHGLGRLALFVEILVQRGDVSALGL